MKLKATITWSRDFNYLGCMARLNETVLIMIIIEEKNKQYDILHHSIMTAIPAK